MGLVRRAIAGNARMNERFAEVQRKYRSGAYPSFDSIFVWNDMSGRDLFAKVTRSHKIITVLEALFDDRVYVYHNKVVLKYPGMPGFKYHQDYFYWYYMGNLFPDLVTAFIAVDAADEANGCLKVIEGSHKLGRLDHKLYDGISDSGVEPQRLEVICARLPERALVLDVGDVAIFHCNTLHGADPNQSDASRLAVLGCYNTKHNDPYVKHVHPNFSEQEVLYDRITESDLEALPDLPPLVPASE
jgi:ectoine hydroxylase